MPKSLSQRLRRFFASSEELEAEDLAERTRAEGLSTIAEAEVRTLVTLRGVVASTTTTPRGWLEAELSDGTGAVTLVWMGYSRLDAVLPGRSVRITGRIADERGRLVMYNPTYEVVV